MFQAGAEKSWPLVWPRQGQVFLELCGNQARLAWACSVAWPEEGKGTAATFEIWLRLFWPWLHRDEAPGTTLTQWDTVRNTDLQGSPLPAAGRAEGQGGRVLYAHFPKGPQTHPWQCAASMPTSSPMRLSSGGWERCRHTTRSS